MIDGPLNFKEDMSRPLAFIVVGASGDLAQRKIMPALFSLYARGLLPPETAFFGFARREMTDAVFRSRLSGSLACRYTPERDCDATKSRFLQRCFYVSGEYSDPGSFLDLYREIRRCFADEHPNCVYYLAIPPTIFLACARAMGDSGLAQCGPSPFWSRVVVEKPFGHDRDSSDSLVAGLSHVFSEASTFRIDHYLGKEIIQNLQVLRFANRFFELLWNRDAIERVEIDWRETLGVENRASYFDRYGIIRDVVQNHLLQIVALVGMERPESRSPTKVRDAKVALLRAIHPPGLEEVRLGQYAAGQLAGNPRMAYRDEDGVPADSCTPTFARMRLTIDNPRWSGVPFFVSAGKAMDANRTEIRLVFRETSEPWFESADHVGPANMLVIRVQPQEAIRLRVITKEPGLASRTVPTDLQLVYGDAFQQTIPEAYERLLLDVVQGDKSLFIREDELGVGWDIFSPLLHEIEQRRIEPAFYAFGSSDLPD